MSGKDSYSPLTLKLVNSLYVDAMLLADEARSYFDNFSRGERDLLEPMQRVTFSCESLKVTTRLMSLIAWLLTVKADASGEIDANRRNSPAMRLGNAATSDLDAITMLPQDSLVVIKASIELYRRARALDIKLAATNTEMERPFSPVFELRGALERAF
jgi:regulator of CtrA degradation